MSVKIKAWHFLSADRRLRYGSREIVEAGKTYTCDWPYRYGDSVYEKPTMCAAGMHGSKRVLDALSYAPGPIVCRVEIYGDVVREKNKLVGRYRSVLAMADAHDVLVEFACTCAEHALKRHWHSDDRRPWQATAAVRRYQSGEPVDLHAAADAANAAAYAAAYAAANAAADAAYAVARAARAAAYAAQNRLLTTMVNKLLEET